MYANPYAADLGDRDPWQAIGETPQRIASIVQGWTEEDFERSYAPGKWSARKILVHLAQTELALGTRVRFALTEDNYAAQSFNQDGWMPLDEHMDARTALNAYLALRQMNVAMWRALSGDQRNRTFTHSEYGELSVGWVAHQMAGHDLHHLKHFERVDALRQRPTPQPPTTKM